MKRRRRIRLRALPVRDYLRFHIVLGVALELVQAALIAGLAISRASAHRLSATEAGIIIALAPIFGAFSGAVLTYYLALSEGISGLVVRDEHRELRAAA